MRVLEYSGGGGGGVPTYGLAHDGIITPPLSQPIALNDKPPFSDNGRRRELAALESRLSHSLLER